MNIVSWNCWGALNPLFNNFVRDLVHTLSPTVLIITETKVSGTRAKNITVPLPFDRAIQANNIGLTGGLWVLWDSCHRQGFVSVYFLASLSYIR